MAGDGQRKRREGIWLVKYFISTWGTTLTTRKAPFFIHIFINIESFLIVKLWNANIEMSWCWSYSFSFYRVGGSAFLWVVLGISKWAFLVRVGFEAAYKYKDKKAEETKKIENAKQKKEQKSPCQFILREVRKFPYIFAYIQ